MWYDVNHVSHLFSVMWGSAGEKYTPAVSWALVCLCANLDVNGLISLSLVSSTPTWDINITILSVTALPGC